MSNLLVCSFMLLETSFGSTVLGIVSKDTSLWVVGGSGKSCCWSWRRCREPVFVAISQQRVVHLIIFASLVGERWCLSIVWFFMFSLFFLLWESIKFTLFSHVQFISVTYTWSVCSHQHCMFLVRSLHPRRSVLIQHWLPCSLLSIPDSLFPTFQLSINLRIMGTSCKWNRTKFVPLSLVYFTK